MIEYVNPSRKCTSTQVSHTLLVGASGTHTLPGTAPGSVLAGHVAGENLLALPPPIIPPSPPPLKQDPKRSKTGNNTDKKTSNTSKNTDAHLAGSLEGVYQAQ